MGDMPPHPLNQCRSHLYAGK